MLVRFLLLPAQNITLRQGLDPKPAEHVKELRSMVHAVSDDMRNAAAIRLFGRGPV